MYKIYYSRIDGNSICLMCVYKNSDGTCNNTQKVEQDKNSTACNCAYHNCCEYFREVIKL